MKSPEEFDLVVIGGGAIGLSIAWEVGACGPRVVVVDRLGGPLSSSWAAAGMLPPMDPARARDPLDRLHGLSHQLYPDWVANLQRVSGIDVEFRRCGGLHLARTPGEAAALRAICDNWAADGVQMEPIHGADIRRFEPALNDAIGTEDFHIACYVPAEGQVRTPRLLQALRRAGETCGVHFVAWQAPITIERCMNEAWQVRSEELSLTGRAVCFAAGAWTAPLLATLGVRLDLEPRRGQMILLAPCGVGLRGIVNEGPRYLVPRLDGRILVGSTVEDVGFDQSTNPKDLQVLQQFAGGLVPQLALASMEASWAGLRPRTGDGYPFLGRLPGNSHAYIAAGHFRDGIQLAPITGRVMCDVILQRQPPVDLAPFRADRK